MIVPIVLATAYAAGVDPWRLALLAVAVYAPLVVLAVAALLSWRGRQADDLGPALFAETVASELRGGASLRDAIVVALDPAEGMSRPGVGRLRGLPIAGLAGVAADRYPSIGEEIRQTIARAARSGSDMAALFDEIGSLALAQSEVRREVSIATAPGRATALVLAGAPTAYVVARAMSGDVERLLRSSQQRIVAILGLGLFVVGVLLTCLVMWRAGR